MEHWNFHLFWYHRLRRIQDLNHRVLKLSRESLLSLSSQFVLHSASELPGRSGGRRRESTSRVDRSKMLLDNQAVLVNWLRPSSACFNPQPIHITTSLVPRLSCVGAQEPGNEANITTSLVPRLASHHLQYSNCTASDRKLGEGLGMRL